MTSEVETGGRTRSTTFPDDFLWGAATSAHQVEGGNVGSDWWQFEHAPGTAAREPSLFSLLAEDAKISDQASDMRRAMLEQFDRTVDVLTTARAAVLVAECEAGTWRGAGDPTFEAWRGRTSRAGQRVAAAQVRQADQLAAVPRLLRP